jgi:arylsulfatase A-like enzyme/Flp pilus assembly protein TadD
MTSCPMLLLRHVMCVMCLAASTLAAAPPNIILITLDTTRADRMGFLGSKLGLTPNLDSLARGAAVFTRAYSQAPLTTTSHATILTGTYPQFHQVNNFGLLLGKDLPYAPAILKAQGYHTAAFIGALVLDPAAGAAPGFERGFDTYDAGFHMSAGKEDHYHSIERRGGDVVERALAWLNQHPQGPFFLWVHLYDAHDPYESPEPFKSKYASAPYDGEIAYADSAVGTLLGQLRERRLYDGAIIAVMADHGEGLGDHGEDTHGIFLYDETIHVPLVIKLPGDAPAGIRIENRVELVDVLPTILQAAGVVVPPEVQGKSLLGMMTVNAADENGAAPERSTDRPAYAETDYGYNAYGWSPLRSLRTGKYLYVDAPRRELYDQSVDPNAGHDLSSSSTAVTTTLAGQLDAFRDKTSSKQTAPKAFMDPEVQEKLAALGYVATNLNSSKPGGNNAPSDPNVSSGNASDGKAINPRGVDPKDKIEIANLIHRANLLVEDGHCPESIPLLRQAIVREPGMSLLYTKLGHCLLQMNDYVQAVPVLRKVAESNPNLANPHFQLGEALIATRDFAAAALEFEKVVAILPRWERAHVLLATAYVRTNRIPEAIKECDQVLSVAPDDYEANLVLGRALLLSGKPDEALPKLTKAVALQPKAPEPHTALSNAYRRLGRMEDAAREQIEAGQLREGRPE